MYLKLFKVKYKAFTRTPTCSVAAVTTTTTTHSAESHQLTRSLGKPKHLSLIDKHETFPPQKAVL